MCHKCALPRPGVQQSARGRKASRPPAMRRPAVRCGLHPLRGWGRFRSRHSSPLLAELCRG
eukprot:2121552-Prorocentrum_lima.AAC.1